MSSAPLPRLGTSLIIINLCLLRQRLQSPQWQLIKAPMEVSARKYNKLGVWPSLAVNFSVMALFRIFDLPPQPLKEELYHRRFSTGWRFWKEWSESVFVLLRQHTHKDP